MSPTVRVTVTVVFAFLAGGVLASVHGPVVAGVQQLRVLCLAQTGNVSTPWCSTVIRYPNRLPALALALLVAAVVVLAALLARWCLRPLETLRGVVARMGPTNLGQRVGLARRDDVFSRLGAALDALLDRIAGGYASQSRFAATASHELRTPLAVQRTLLEVGLTSARTPDQLALLSTQLLETNRRNERLIEGLLALSEAEQAPLGHTPQRLDAIAGTVVEAHQDRAHAAGVDLTLHAVATTIAGEELLLERLVANLVQNGIAYNLPEHGNVHVEVGPEALVVTNAGPVIATEEVDRLFDPFYRGSGERLVNGGGAGLGLTITRAIAQTHAATVTAAPGPAGGLVVRVRFPSASGTSLR